jgi:hypothetical protein
MRFSLDSARANVRLFSLYGEICENVRERPADSQSGYVVDPEKVIFRQIEFEYCGLSGLPG